MRTIPAPIIEKLKSLQQTKANNADPRINLVMQRTRRYIEQGSTLNPVTLWDRPGLGSIDISYRRESRMTAPDKIYIIYIESGEAHVARTDYIKSIEQANEWEYLYTLGPAVDVAIEFDGRWERTHRDAEVCFDSPAQWTHVTMGDPYIFLVLADGSLTVQQGQGVPTTLATGVSKVAALRGWKNVYRWQHDHGVICAYIKSNAVHYRTFALQGSEANPQPAAWEAERQVTVLPTPAVNVGLFRTNDFRAGFLCESNGEIHWAITDRNWAGMAIRDHTVRARGTGLSALLTRIFYHERYSIHTIAATGSEVQALYCPNIYPEVISARNIDEQTILVYTDLPLFGDLTGLESAFTVTDELSASYPVSATKRGSVYPSRLFIFDRDSVAYHPETGAEVAVNTSVYVEFAGGRKGSLMCEGTENLLTANQSSFETSSSWSITNYSHAQSTDWAFHGNYSSKAIKVSGDRGYLGQDVPISGIAAGTKYTGLTHVYVPPGSSYIGKNVFILFRWTGGAFANADSTREYYTLAEGVNKLTITKAIDQSDRTGVRCNFWEAVGHEQPAGSFLYLDGFLIARKDYSLPWHIGGSTRTDAIKSIPVTLPESFGIGVSAKMLHASTTKDRTIWECGDYRCYYDATAGKLKMTGCENTAHIDAAWAAEDFVGIYAGRKNGKLFVQAKVAGVVGDCAIAPCGEAEAGETLYLGSKADGSENINAVIGGFVQHDPHAIDADSFFATVPGGGE